MQLWYIHQVSWNQWYQGPREFLYFFLFFNISWVSAFGYNLWCGCGGWKYISSQWTNARVKHVNTVCSSLLTSKFLLKSYFNCNWMTYDVVSFIVTSIMNMPKWYYCTSTLSKKSNNAYRVYWSWIANLRNVGVKFNQQNAGCSVIPLAVDNQRMKWSRSRMKNVSIYHWNTTEMSGWNVTCLGHTLPYRCTCLTHWFFFV